MNPPDRDIEIPRVARDWKPEVGIVLGSGLGSFVDAIDKAEELAYADVDGLPASAVPGHAGRFVYGEVGGKKVVAAQGRVHLYEGWSAAEVTSTVRFLGGLGIDLLILTNAAGAANTEFAVGRWMQISDHLNLTGTTPLLGGPNFHDMTEVYSTDVRSSFMAAALQRGIPLLEGVYAGLLGPQYETPAEVEMLRRLGADAVGMSTVLEAIQARALGLKVAGFSCLTNLAAGLGDGNLDHSEVLDVGSRAADQMVELLNSFLAGA